MMMMNSINVDDSNNSSADALDLSGALMESIDSGEQITEMTYKIVPNPRAEKVDLSKLRGVASHNDKKKDDPPAADTDLENLAELVPDVKARQKNGTEYANSNNNNNEIQEGDDAVEVVKGEEKTYEAVAPEKKRYAMFTTKSDNLNRIDSMQVQGDSVDVEQKSKIPPSKKHPVDYYHAAVDEASLGNNVDDTMSYGNEGGYNEDDACSDCQAINDEDQDQHHGHHHHTSDAKKKNPKEFMNLGSSAQSISTATQTHEVRMPMYLPTFKPATGCTNASDFIVRCFVARLRSGITVVKHGRSRWCKLRLRILHIHPDGRSLSWKPTEGEPASAKRPPKLDLSTTATHLHCYYYYC